jgi:protein ImuB
LLRPSWLLAAPEIMEQRNQRLFWHGYVALLSEPERIIGNWWEAPVARDYYLAKRHDHLHLWIFFNLYDKQWYVHGVFA